MLKVCRLSGEDVENLLPRCPPKQPSKEADLLLISVPQHRCCMGLTSATEQGIVKLCKQINSHPLKLGVGPWGGSVTEAVQKE